MKINFLFALGLIVVNVGLTQAQNIPLENKVRTGKLANGFTYFIRHNETPKNRVVFYLANKVGSVLEEEDQRGLAHFMEHMNFNGTAHFPKNELVNYLQKTGVRFGADINAYTGFDETVYQLPLPSDNPEILEKGIEIMHDWAHGATLDSIEINKERGVILEEKRLGKGAGDRMRTKYYPIILNNSRYASRLPIGTDEVLNNFKPATIRRFYEDWYRPDLQALIVVGDIDVDQLEKTIKAKFADLQNPINEKPRPKYTVALNGKNEFVAVTDPEMTATTAEILYKFPGTELKTEADYRISILRSLYNAMLAGRYAELQRQPAPPFLAGTAGFSSFIGGLDSYHVQLTARTGEMQIGFKAAIRENERARRFGFSAAELSRAKTAYANNLESSLKEADKTNSDSFVKEYLQYFLQGTASPGIAFEYQMATKDLEGISLDELNAMAKNSGKETDRDILILAPAKEQSALPTESVIDSWINAVEKENISPYHEENSTQKLLNTEPKPGRIVKESKDLSLGITTLILSNGITVVLKPTDFKNNEIFFAGFAPGGTSLYSDADYPSASAANAIPGFGAGNYNVSALSKYLAGKQLSVQTSISERWQNVNGGAGNKDLQEALQLMYAYMTEPRKDTLLFHNMIARSKANLLNRKNDPSSVFQDTVSAVLGNYSIRRTPATPARMDRIDLTKAYAIYRERFANAAGFTFVFVGSIDMVAIKPLLAKYIASLPVTGSAKQAKNLHLEIPSGIIAKTVYKGKEDKATVNLVFSGQFDYNYGNILQLNALKEALQIRMLERLREDEGEVYSPAVRVNTQKNPLSRFSLTIAFGCAPRNIEKLIASVLDEVEKFKTQGPSQLNVNKFKAEDLRTREIALKTNGWWLGYLAGALQTGENLQELNTYDLMVAKISPESLKLTAQKYLNGRNFIKLVLMPEKQ